LFAGTFLAVAATFVVVIALVLRGGKKKGAGVSQTPAPR